MLPRGPLATPTTIPLRGCTLAGTFQLVEVTSLGLLPPKPRPILGGSRSPRPPLYSGAPPPDPLEKDPNHPRRIHRSVWAAEMQLHLGASRPGVGGLGVAGTQGFGDADVF